MPGAMRPQFTGISDESIVDFHITVPATMAGDVHPLAWCMLLGFEGLSTCGTGPNEDMYHDALQLRLREWNRQGPATSEPRPTEKSSKCLSILANTAQ